MIDCTFVDFQHRVDESWYCDKKPYHSSHGVSLVEDVAYPVEGGRVYKIFSVVTYFFVP